MLKIPVVLLFCVIVIATAISQGQTPGAQSANPTESQLFLDRVLKDERLWGLDAFAVFASLDRWSQHGESSIVLFADRVSAVNTESHRLFSLLIAYPRARRLKLLRKRSAVLSRS